MELSDLTLPGLMSKVMGNKNPYDSASQYYNQIPGQTAPYYQQYQQSGQMANNQINNQNKQLLGNLPGLQSQYSGLMNDPSAMYNKIAGGYQHSPGFDWQMNQGMNAANNAAASGGMLGSPQHQQQAATMATGLANQDFNNYLGHVLGLYGTGLQGSQGLYNTGMESAQKQNQMGFNANDQMAKIIADSLGNQGNMAFSGQASMNANNSKLWGDIIGGGLAAFGA